MFTGRKLLITGGTGSFGNAVLRRFLNTDIKEIRVFSRDEKKQEDMRIQLAHPKVKFYVGNVRDGRGESTRCDECHKTVICRHGFTVTDNGMKEGSCPSCGNQIAGIW